MENLLTFHASLAKDLGNRTVLPIMDADDVSVPESPIAETMEDSDYDKQVTALQSYLASVPYECESIEEMHAKLEYIVGRILVCAEAKNWLILSTWDGLLQWCAHTCGVL